jgi:hypothetical protein
MRYFKKIFIILAATFFYLNYMIVFAETPEPSQEEPSFLFIQSAREAIIKKDSTEGNYIITLKHVDPWILYFTERPHRNMGFMLTEDFLASMKKQEKKFEPKGLNVAIVSLDNKNKHKTVKYIYTLHSPQYKNKDTIIYRGNLVPSQDVPPTTIVPPSEMTLQHVVLFIDACVGCTPPP